MDGKLENQGLRITTWNVNGIRNPFGYQPWCQERTFAAMFEILQADIVVMQETKIQKKDLRDDMVLVPGWDVFFSLPKHKKGYAGVAVYTRNSSCAPIRAEEGITGVLTPPNSQTSFFDLPEDQQIGGYPTTSQLSYCSLDAATLDSEGRCVVLEFPAFVLIGTYCPANRDESRDEFRIGYLNAVEARVRNLVAAGKRVFWTGDLNIIREEIDTANAGEQLRKQGITVEEYLSTPARRMLNQLLVDGKVFGERDEGREKSIMWDICRSFHPNRLGMFTCWEQKINARPGNFGSRIDYVLCSQDWKDWFCESNIQEGLMGSDHCPVYAVLKEKVEIEGKEVHVRDIMSSGMFKDGLRQRDWSAKDLLPMSARLIPEFNQRRSIRDMFTKKSSLTAADSSPSTQGVQDGIGTTLPDRELLTSKGTMASASTPQAKPEATEIMNAVTTTISQTTLIQSSAKPPKRPIESPTTRPQKRGKPSTSSKSTTSKAQSGKGQSSLMGFFKSKQPQDSQNSSTIDAKSDTATMMGIDTPSESSDLAPPAKEVLPATQSSENLSPDKAFNPAEQKSVHDPIAVKDSWSKLLGKRVVPRFASAKGFSKEPDCISYDLPEGSAHSLHNRKPGTDISRVENGGGIAPEIVCWM
ncbi:hypothetical protein LZ554_005615 [Drepanopeziza brunnea f. sp. 'monogermtubi']|nr:hypothetical protein LZ554_005615 [Drepanopeziza brunnea f. sp. 'monogermtubi']